MNEEQLPGKPVIELVHVLSDSNDDQSLPEEEFLFHPGYPLPWRLALWLDYFLRAGQERLKEKWGQLPSIEQQALGIELLKCYLSQPLFIRLPPREGDGLENQKGISGKEEKLLQLSVQSGTTSELRSFYPLTHQRLWPVLLTVLKEELFSSEEIFQRIRPALIMASSSRLEAIRERSETLGAFFSKRPEITLSPVISRERQSNPEESAPYPISSIPIQTQEVLSSVIAVESSQSAPEGGDDLPTPLAAPPKKKKKKPPSDQLKLF